MGKVIVEVEMSFDGCLGGEHPDFWQTLFQFHTPDVQEYLDNLLFMPDALGVPLAPQISYLLKRIGAGKWAQVRAWPYPRPPDS